jgi:hypothetical protein
MHEVEVYCGSDRTLIRSLEIAMRVLDVEVRIRPFLNQQGELLRTAYGNEPLFRVVLTPIRARTNELLNEVRRVPSTVVHHAEGFVAGFIAARSSRSWACGQRGTLTRPQAAFVAR